MRNKRSCKLLLLRDYNSQNCVVNVEKMQDFISNRNGNDKKPFAEVISVVCLAKSPPQHVGICRDKLS